MLQYLFVVGESVGFIVEFLFVNALTQAFLASAFTLPIPWDTYSICNCNTNLLSCLPCVIVKDLPTIILSILHAVTWVAFVTYWFLWRYKIDLKRRLFFKVSSKVYLIFGLSILGCLAVVGLQMYLNHWIYSQKNFVVQLCEGTECKTAFAYVKILQMIVGSPILEEVILRIILFTLFVSRVGDVLFSVFFTNLCFSSLHIVNVLRDASSFYTIFQVLMAILIGMFYSTRYYLTNNAFEVIVLHIINNLFASLVPIDIKSDELYPYFFYPIAFTTIYYFILLYQDIVEIARVFAEKEESEKKVDSKKQK